MSSFIIEEHFVKQYNANVAHLSQQKMSKFAPLVRHETHIGEEAFYDFLGMVTAQQKTDRFGDTPRMDIPHSRRRAMIADYHLSLMVDKQDKLRLLYSPESPYATAMAAAMARTMDDVIIKAALGTAWAGNDGSQQVALPASQKVVAYDGITTTGLNLNVETLRKVAALFDKNEVDASLTRYMAISSEQLSSLLREVEVTNGDYNTVRALVDGKVDTFMGFKFIKSERLNKYAAGALSYDPASGAFGAGAGNAGALPNTIVRECFAWAGDGLLLSVGANPDSKVDVLPNKSYATQLYTSMSIGATRMEEAKVVGIYCQENA